MNNTIYEIHRAFSVPKTTAYRIAKSLMPDDQGLYDPLGFVAVWKNLSVDEIDELKAYGAVSQSRLDVARNWLQVRGHLRLSSPLEIHPLVSSTLPHPPPRYDTWVHRSAVTHLTQGLVTEKILDSYLESGLLSQLSGAPELVNIAEIGSCFEVGYPPENEADPITWFANKFREGPEDGNFRIALPRLVSALQPVAPILRCNDLEDAAKVIEDLCESLKATYIQRLSDAYPPEG
jgi:hypothetical protein